MTRNLNSPRRAREDARAPGCGHGYGCGCGAREDARAPTWRRPLRIAAGYVVRIVAGVALAGCAGSPDRGELDTAPYKAVIVFEWMGVEPRPAADGEEGAAALPVPRRWVEDEFLAGLDEHRVFSDFVCADWETMDEMAVAENADLIVLVRIGAVARWDSERVRIVPGLALLDGALWFGTAIGGWWVPDREFETASDIEVAWKRPRPPPFAKSGRRPQSVADLKTEFHFGERLSSGDYRLSLWERAKLWRYPWAYLMNLVVPAAVIPLHDSEEVSRSLVVAAVEDLERQLAEKLRTANVGAGRAPYLFRLEEPSNGAAVEGPNATLRYRYRLEPGFDEHEPEGLLGLRIELKRGDSADYVTLRNYREDAIRALNDRIRRDEPIEDQLEGLGRGLNLVRFSAQTKIGRQWVTNTIALHRP